jgi:hypothetical protein
MRESAGKRTIVVDVSLIRELVVILCCVLSTVALLAYLALTGVRTVAAEAETAQAASDGMRQFYLTKDGYQGDAAKTACAAGYHMASFWEIADPSNLKYSTTLGHTLTDSGQGPPSFYGGVLGWVHTGYVAHTAGDVGRANCNLWTSPSASHRGTSAYLHYEWTGGWQDIGVWSVGHSGCQLENHVWCIED